MKWCDLFVAVFTARPKKPGRQIHQRPRGRDTTAWSAKLGISSVHRSFKIEGQKMNLDLCWFLCRRSSTECVLLWKSQNSARSDIEPWPTSPCRWWLYWHSLASNLGIAVIIQIHWFPKALSRLETVHAECEVQCGSALFIWMWQSQ